MITSRRNSTTKKIFRARLSYVFSGLTLWVNNCLQSVDHEVRSCLYVFTFVYTAHYSDPTMKRQLVLTDQTCFMVSHFCYWYKGFTARMLQWIWPWIDVEIWHHHLLCNTLGAGNYGCMSCPCSLVSVWLLYVAGNSGDWWILLETIVRLSYMFRWFRCISLPHGKTRVLPLISPNSE